MYDVAIIGGGPAAIFAAYEFVLKYPQLRYYAGGRQYDRKALLPAGSQEG